MVTKATTTRPAEAPIIEQVDTLEEFQRLKTAWDAIYLSDPEAHFFLSFKWLAGVLETYPERWVVLVARGADGGYLGFLPLQRETLWSKSRQRLRNELRFAGRLFWADYGGILCLPEHEDEVHAALGSHLKRMEWSEVHLKGFRASERRFDRFMAQLTDDRLAVESRQSIINDGETDNLICPYVDLPDTFEAYLTQRLSPNSRQKTRRLLRTLEGSPEYRLTTTDAATQSRDVQILETLWYKMWRPSKGPEAERKAKHYGTIVKRGLDDGMVHMPVLWHGETPVGVLASFIDREKSRMLFFIGCREEAFQGVPAGVVLHTHNIRWAIEHGLKTYDLLRGNEPYKYSLGATDTRLKYAVVNTKSGTNLNGKLDPRSVAEALRLAEDFAGRERTLEAMTVCHQILTTVPGHQPAKRLLTALVEAL